jgi:hypothetical protein
MYTEQQKAHLNNVTNNITNNTTGVNTTVEKISNDDNQQSQVNNEKTEPLEFNGKTHSQNVAEAYASPQSAGMSYEQVDAQMRKEEADGGRV